uniref:Collagen alpha-1(I) chain-like n=1 Tax=Caenorhabditis tropicalis TaxID=1561998 RepID=A0A1I7UU88_9PELO
MPKKGKNYVDGPNGPDGPGRASPGVRAGPGRAGPRFFDFGPGPARPVATLSFSNCFKEWMFPTFINNTKVNYGFFSFEFLNTLLKTNKIVRFSPLCVNRGYIIR